LVVWFYYSNDKIAVVVGVSKAAMRPKVKVLQDGKEGELIDSK
jgi:hypothetical protein